MIDWDNNIGKIVEIRAWDHAENSNDLVQVYAWGRLVRVTRYKLVVRTFECNETHEHTNIALIRSAVLDGKLLNGE